MREAWDRCVVDSADAPKAVVQLTLLLEDDPEELPVRTDETQLVGSDLAALMDAAQPPDHPSGHH